MGKRKKDNATFGVNDPNTVKLWSSTLAKEVEKGHNRYLAFDDEVATLPTGRAPIPTNEFDKYVSIRGKEYYFDKDGAIQRTIAMAGEKVLNYNPEKFNGYWVCEECLHCNDLLYIDEAWPLEDAIIYCRRCDEPEVLEQVRPNPLEGFGKSVDKAIDKAVERGLVYSDPREDL